MVEKYIVRFHFDSLEQQERFESVAVPIFRLIKPGSKGGKDVLVGDDCKACDGKGIINARKE